MQIKKFRDRIKFAGVGTVFQMAVLFRPKTLDGLDRDQNWSSKCGAPQDRADLNRRPDATASRRNAARHRLLTAAPFVENSLRTVLLRPHRP
jgi:hypothetical protein